VESALNLRQQHHKALNYPVKYRVADGQAGNHELAGQSEIFFFAVFVFTVERGLNGHLCLCLGESGSG